MGTASNVKLGPGLLYAAAVGTPEPATLATTLDAAWLAGEMGYTDGGSTFNLQQTWEGTSVAEEVLPILYGVTSAEFGISFDLAEITALNISRALNGGTITTTSRLVPGAAIAASTADDLWTSSLPHRLVVGDAIVLGAITSIVTSPVVTAGPTYYVAAIPSPTTFKVSTTLGGAAVDVTTAGTTLTVTETNDLTTYEPPNVGEETRLAILWKSVTTDEIWVFRKCIQTGAVAIPRQKAPNKAVINMQFQCEVPTGLKPFKAWFEAA